MKFWRLLLRSLVGELTVRVQMRQVRGLDDATKIRLWRGGSIALRDANSHFGTLGLKRDGELHVVIDSDEYRESVA